MLAWEDVEIDVGLAIAEAEEVVQKLSNTQVAAVIKGLAIGEPVVDFGPQKQVVN